MNSRNSHAFGYLAVFSFGMFVIGLVYQMLIGGRGFIGAIFMALIFAAFVAAIIYLFLMTTLGKDWSRVAAKTIEAKAGEVKAKVDQARAPAPEPETPVADTAAMDDPVDEVVTAPDAAPVEEAAPEVVAAPEAVAAPAERPAALSAPEGGVADDLKRIKGVGPKLEKVLNGLGFYHFHQIAAWGDEEVAWVDDNLEGFKGRVSRDNWVAQAKDLAG